MEPTKMEEHHQGGKLVALEGDIETISTQLRLLPPSQKILVLPSFSDGLTRKCGHQPFSARAFIHDVYIAFKKRIETARSFLEFSTHTQPRLVFMNGGSVCARKTCINKISEKLTGGDFEGAEAIFNIIIQYGAANLLAPDDFAVGEEQSNSQARDAQNNEAERLEEPITRIVENMKSMEHKSGLVQNGGIGHHDDNCTIHTSRSRSTRQSFPAAEIPKHSSPLQLFGSKHATGDIATSALSDQNSPLHEPTTIRYQHSLKTRSSYYPFGCEDSEFDEDPSDEHLISIPPSPDVEYGEAFLVDVQAVSHQKQLSRVRSVDEFSPQKPRPQIIREDATFQHYALPAYSLSTRPVSSIALGRREFQTPQKQSFLKASETTIVRSSTSNKSAPEKEISLNAPVSYVDRGTETTDLQLTFLDMEDDEDFVPVFPLVEDLIILLMDGKSDEVLDSVVQSYKDGSYPMMPLLPPSITERSSSLNSSRNLSFRNSDEYNDIERSVETESEDPGYESHHSYGPYRFEDRFLAGIERTLLSGGKLFRADSGVQIPDTPPAPPSIRNLRPLQLPLQSDLDEKFIEFSTAGASNTINVQNSLRQLFSVHLPAGENGFNQHSYIVTPEANRLWKPVFRNDDIANIGNGERTVDQIIALGCEPGVRKEFFNKISGDVERLGMRKNGISRSAKIDISYLITNMMQNYLSLPLTVQSTFNPLSDPTALATLLVPQLEAYLASNTSTRLLILHYPPNHLSTVFALRKLLGTDIMKIGSILNSLASDPPSSVSRTRTPFSKFNSNPLLNEALSSRTLNITQRATSLQKLNRKSSASNPILSKVSSLLRTPSTAASLAKANYLLPSTATDNEITNFLSSIWRCLMEKPSFYTPEPDLESEQMLVEKILTSRSSTARKTPSFLTGFSASSFTPPSSTSTFRTQQQRGYNMSRLNSPTKMSSGAPSVKMDGSGSGNGKWDNFYIGDEDSDDDDFDKMILGRKHAKIVPEVRRFGPGSIGVESEKSGDVKRNKQKALKWLGLA